MLLQGALRLTSLSNLGSCLRENDDVSKRFALAY